jgi:hypothetical protein
MDGVARSGRAALVDEEPVRLLSGDDLSKLLKCPARRGAEL